MEEEIEGFGTDREHGCGRMGISELQKKLASGRQLMRSNSRILRNAVELLTLCGCLCLGSQKSSQWCVCRKSATSPMIMASTLVIPALSFSSSTESSHMRREAW